jgi:hypothetical protein
MNDTLKATNRGAANCRPEPNGHGRTLAALGSVLSAPPGLSESHPRRVPHRLQAAGGSLRRSCARDPQRLEAIGAKHSKIKLRTQPREFDFAPGTILLREWGDRDHRVTVTAEGLFEYEGHTFKSLTAVARHITGAHWSGPLFFGLVRKGGAR